MSTHIGIGFSHDFNTEKAAREAALEASAQLKSASADFILILSTAQHEPNAVIQNIYNLFQGSKIIGCSTAGIILNHAVITHGIAILAIASKDIKFGIGCARDITTANIQQKGSEMARKIISDFGQHRRQVCIFFIDGQIADGSRLLKGVQEIFGNVFPLVGAGSCDDFRFEQTFQVFQDRVLRHAALGVMMGGQVSVGISGYHGWRPLGKPRLINKVDGNVIRTIDGKKASSLYEEYFEEEYENLHSTPLGQMSILYPLGIFVEGSREYLLRNAVNILDDGSIVCQGGVPENSVVHIMIGNKDSCKQAATQACEEAKQNLLGKKPQLIIIIESMARLKLLGRAAIQEIENIKKVFGTDVPIFGMYAHGEICPFQTVERIKKPYLQNESIVVLAIS